MSDKSTSETESRRSYRRTGKETHKLAAVSARLSVDTTSGPKIGTAI